MLKPNERVIEFPCLKHDVDVERLARKYIARPGTWVGVHFPPTEKIGNILLYDAGGDGYETSQGAAGKMKADCCTVVSVGTVPEMWYDIKHPMLESAISLQEQLKPGDRVLVAPYSVTRTSTKDGDICVGGLGDDWRDTTLFKEDGGYWVPLSNWIVANMIPKESLARMYGGKIMRDFSQDLATVFRVGPECKDVRQGDLIITHPDRTDIRPDDSRWFVAPRGPYGDRAVFFRETDSEGVERVVAVENR